ncbi:MAG: hypothetical protein QNJ18_11905 [Xenococcaceae cyanobacterium MO_167.B52]|nr:hypothetical protein [Xenococcaceae cyanobacterium MO_167.B52]
MRIKTNSRNDDNDKILTSLNPYSNNFDFELWSRAVRQQMLDALQKPSKFQLKIKLE